LNSAESRKAYDATSAGYEILVSDATDLTEANYESLVLQSDEPWVIQVYTDWDPVTPPPFFNINLFAGAGLWRIQVNTFKSH
jgi:hypothetical protein